MNSIAFHRSHQQACDFGIPHGGVSCAIHPLLEKTQPHALQICATLVAIHSTAMRLRAGLMKCPRLTSMNKTHWVLDACLNTPVSSRQKKVRTTQRWHCCEELGDKRPLAAATDFLYNVTTEVIIANFVDGDSWFQNRSMYDLRLATLQHSR